MIGDKITKEFVDKMFASDELQAVIDMAKNPHILSVWVSPAFCDDGNQANIVIVSSDIDTAQEIIDSTRGFMFKMVFSIDVLSVPQLKPGIIKTNVEEDLL